MKKISVLTPAYNAEAYIGETIESILGQTFADFEYIIFDDCSTDGTWEIIIRYAEKDSRIVPVQGEKNLGFAGAYGRLASLATGEYVAWQSADDISMPYRLEHQLRFMENNPDVGVCGGYILLFDREKEIGVRNILSTMRVSGK